MNYRKVNWCFLGMIMLHLGVVGLLLALRNVYSMGMVTNLLVSELILAVPALRCSPPGRNPTGCWVSIN